MAKRPPRSKPKQGTSSNALLEALAFVAVAAKEIGPPFETHVKLANGWAIMSNGVLAVGHKIAEDVYACPHTLRFVSALSKCTEELSITQLESKISVKSGKFRAIVPTLDPAMLAPVQPDAPVAIINENIKLALATVGTLCNETAQHVHLASTLLQSGSAVGTDGHLLLEYWHGVDLPPGLALPKIAVNAIIKTQKKLTRFGFAPGNSATFYFEDESWIKTQLYADAWPDINRVLDVPAQPWPLQAGLFEALKAVTSFSEDGFVRFDKGVLRSHDISEAGASYEVEGLPEGPIYDAKRLAMLEPLAKSVDWFGGNDKVHAYFFGDNLRGALTGIRKQAPRPQYKAPELHGADANPDDDIPF